MKGMETLRKSAVMVAMCLAVLWVSGCKPTPEQVAERTKLLYEAIRIDNLEQAKSCIKAGADVNATDSEGISVLTHAILYGKNDIADLLRAAGAKE